MSGPDFCIRHKDDVDRKKSKSELTANILN